MSDSKPDRRQQAQIYCRRALNYYEQNNRPAAIKALGMALDLDSSLRTDPRIQRFAVELIGQSAEQSILTLLNRSDRETMASVLTKKPVKRSSILQRRLYYAALGLVIAVFGAFSSIQKQADQSSIGQSSDPTTSTADPLFSDGQFFEHQLAGDSAQKYLVASPLGVAPEQGWKVIVTIHEASRDGSSTVGDIYGVTQKNDYLVIAPTFPMLTDGKLDGHFYKQMRENLLNILDEVRVNGQTDPKLRIRDDGYILASFGEGAALATYMAQQENDSSIAHATQTKPLGIVLFNIRGQLFDPHDASIPYLLLSQAINYDDERANANRYYNRLIQLGLKPQIDEYNDFNHTPMRSFTDWVYDMLSNPM